MAAKAKAVDNVPPHNNDAEMALLGCILLDNSLIDDISTKVRPEDFYRPTHQELFAVMSEMRNKGLALDMVTVREYLGSDTSIEGWYLIELGTKVVSTSNWETYSEIVRKTSILRQLIRIGVDAQALGYDIQPDDVENAVAEVQSKVMGLSLATTKDAVPVGTALHELWKAIREGGYPYVTPHGLKDFRIFDGDLIVVAGGTSAGKTAKTLDWCDEWSKTMKVAYFEYEMTAEQLIARLVCKHAGVGLFALQDGDLTSEEFDRVQDAMLELSKRDLYLEEVYCNNQILFSKIRRAAAKGVELVCIDHCGLIPISEKVGSTNDAKAIGKYITNPLKRLATELGIKIVLLVQLNREGQQPAQFPKKRHLRDSGEIEQDASGILMLWSDYELNDDQSKRAQIRDDSGILNEHELMSSDFNLVRIGIEKQRQGRSGWGKFFIFHGEHFRYEDRAEELSPILDRPMFGKDD